MTTRFCYFQSAFQTQPDRPVFLLWAWFPDSYLQQCLHRPLCSSILRKKVVSQVRTRRRFVEVCASEGASHCGKPDSSRFKSWLKPRMAFDATALLKRDCSRQFGTKSKHDIRPGRGQRANPAR